MPNGGITPSQVVGVAPAGTILLVRDGTTYYELLLEGLNSMFTPGEWLWTEDILDSRTAQAEVVALDVAGGTYTVGQTLTDDITVPSGELWVVQGYLLTANAVPVGGGRVTYNVLVSSFPVTAAGTNKALFDAEMVTPNGTTEIYRIASGELVGAGGVAVTALYAALGEDLRVVGPATITLRLTVSVVFAAGDTQTVTLDLYGRKVHKVVS